MRKFVITFAITLGAAALLYWLLTYLVDLMATVANMVSG
jgi:hypothetical protein